MTEPKVLLCNTTSFGEAYHVCAAVVLQPEVRWKAQKSRYKTAARAFIGAFARDREMREGDGEHSAVATAIVASEFRRRTEDVARESPFR
jgi:hypothetical protein